jgi:hypothetical protein
MSSCALNQSPNSDGSCLSDGHVAIISKYDTNLSKIKNECDNDKCILEKIDIPIEVKSKIEREALKAPTKSLDHEYWLNNTEIDTVMSQLRRLYKGFTHGFIHMSDLVSFPPANINSFDYPVYDVHEIDFGKELKYALVKSGRLSGGEVDSTFTPKLQTFDGEPMSSFGIVCNTDTSKGSGQHWFALFISSDQVDPSNTSKPWIRIELFNSAGGGSGSSVFDNFWETQALNIMKETGVKCTFDIVSTLQHQGVEAKYKNSGNCGSYSLFYIYSRLNGAKPSEFDNPKKIISDYSMQKFRSVCFEKKE